MRILRIIIGYGLAAFGAAFAMSALAFSPATLDAAVDKAPDILEKAWNSSLYMATVIAFLGAIPALIAIQYAEHHKIRSWFYYAGVFALVGTAMYALAHATETVPAKADPNAYATIVMALSGIVFGTLYWVFSGRHAGIEKQHLKSTGGAMSGQGKRASEMKVKTDVRATTGAESSPKRPVAATASDGKSEKKPKLA